MKIADASCESCKTVFFLVKFMHCSKKIKDSKELTVQIKKIRLCTTSNTTLHPEKKIFGQRV